MDFFHIVHNAPAITTAPVSSPISTQSSSSSLHHQFYGYHCVGPIQNQVGQLHTENICLLVLDNSTPRIIQGCPWLISHNPIPSWSKTVSPDFSHTSNNLLQHSCDLSELHFHWCYAPFSYSYIYYPKWASKLHFWTAPSTSFLASQCPKAKYILFSSQNRRPWRSVSRWRYSRLDLTIYLPCFFDFFFLWDHEGQSQDNHKVLLSPPHIPQVQEQLCGATIFTKLVLLRAYK